MKTNQIQLFGLTLGLAFLSLLRAGAATPSYLEDFESYAIGDTPVTNFTEVDTDRWTIVAPSFSSQGYQNDISVFSPGIGVSAGENSSALVEFPTLAASNFYLATDFVIDSLVLDGLDPNNTAFISLVARGADGSLASSGGDRYQVSYYLDDDGLGHPTGRLYLSEHNLFFGDSLNKLSARALPVTPGNVYTMIFEGKVVGGTLQVRGTLMDVTASTAIVVVGTDSANILGGSYFGYFNNVRVEDGGTVALNADFDNFNAARRRPR